MNLIYAFMGGRSEFDLDGLIDLTIVGLDDLKLTTLPKGTFKSSAMMENSLSFESLDSFNCLLSC